MRWWLMETVVDEKEAEEEDMIGRDYRDCRRKNTLYKKQPRPMSLANSLTVTEQKVDTNHITGLLPLSEIWIQKLDFQMLKSSKGKKMRE